MTASRQDGAHCVDRLKSWHCRQMVEAGWSQTMNSFTQRWNLVVARRVKGASITTGASTCKHDLRRAARGQRQQDAVRSGLIDWRRRSPRSPLVTATRKVGTTAA
ncbi:hypothetical protein L917_05125 [Phytophthora nicotianae]|uniref:Uncharacterized protein n=1 Tax=Phytophthora nicotianae TaxID=4792 RepID=W2LLV3_PHYNI|nr:hypothetical protein L917_05125 [Phytophthora nicotianae]ETM50841.1 hypothetical protein L914_05241 [Phytophthora nicotianae]